VWDVKLIDLFSFLPQGDYVFWVKLLVQLLFFCVSLLLIARKYSQWLIGLAVILIIGIATIVVPILVNTLPESPQQDATEYIVTRQ